MARPKRSVTARFRVGRNSVFEHHGAWWLYCRDGNRQVRRKVAATRDQAEQVAAQVNAQLARGEPSLLDFTPISVLDLRRQFLEFHRNVLNSSVGTVRRYDTATRHLEHFVL